MNFSQIDTFGISIGLQYLNRDQFRTNFGSIITLIVAALIAAQTVFTGSELILKENPEVIFAEQFVASPEKFTLKKDTFNFAFGAQFPGNYSQFIDESIYTVSASQLSMKKVFNETTRQYDQIWDSQDIKINPCKISNFGVKETADYFSTLSGVDQMYCLDQESQELFMEGNFDQDSYGVIQIIFKFCTGQPNCREIDEIKKILTNSFVSFNSDDIIVNPKNVNPFTVVGRDFYWNASPIFAKDVYMYFRNIYVESDKGIFFEEKSYQRQTAHSYQSEQVIFKFFCYNQDQY